MIDLDKIKKKKENLINIEESIINEINSGIINPTNKSILYYTFIHCLENITIFNKEEVNNINNSLNAIENE